MIAVALFIAVYVSWCLSNAWRSSTTAESMSSHERLLKTRSTSELRRL